MSVAITKWITLIGPGMRFCPNPLIKQEVISVLRDFCKRTRLWHGQLGDIDIVADQTGYDLTSATGDIASVRHVEVSDVPIDPVDEVALDRENTAWRTTTGEVFGYYMGQDRTLQLVYAPVDAATDGLAVWVNYMPALTATTVQDFLYNDHRDLIALGARARIMAHEDRPWSNASKAEAYRNQYNDQVDIIAASSGKAMTPATTRQTLRSRATTISYF